MIRIFGQNGEPDRVIVTKNPLFGGEIDAEKDGCVAVEDRPIKEKTPAKKRPEKPLLIVKENKYFLDDDPGKEISVGTLNREPKSTEAIAEHRAWSDECPWYGYCLREVDRLKIAPYSCQPCVVFQKEVLAKRAKRIKQG